LGGNCLEECSFGKCLGGMFGWEVSEESFGEDGRNFQEEGCPGIIQIIQGEIVQGKYPGKEMFGG